MKSKSHKLLSLSYILVLAALPAYGSSVNKIVVEAPETKTRTFIGLGKNMTSALHQCSREAIVAEKILLADAEIQRDQLGEISQNVSQKKIFNEVGYGIFNKKVHFDRFSIDNISAERASFFLKGEKKIVNANKILNQWIKTAYDPSEVYIFQLKGPGGGTDRLEGKILLRTFTGETEINYHLEKHPDLIPMIKDRLSSNPDHDFVLCEPKKTSNLKPIMAKHRSCSNRYLTLSKNQKTVFETWGAGNDCHDLIQKLGTH